MTITRHTDHKGYLLTGFVQGHPKEFLMPGNICMHASTAGYFIFRACVVASSEDQARRFLVHYWNDQGGSVDELRLAGVSEKKRGASYLFDERAHPMWHPINFTVSDPEGDDHA